MRHFKPFFNIFLLLLLLSCNKQDEMENNYISLLSLSANGSALTNGRSNVPVDLELSLVFNAALDKEQFKSALSIRSADEEVPLTISFSNALSKAVVTAQLDYSVEYTLNINTEIIGPNARRLEKPLILTFSTMADEVVRSMPPCTSGCKDPVELSIGSEPATFEFYSNYPIYNKNAAWKDLTSAVIVVHGQNRNANDYFSYLSNALSNKELVGSTVLIAPWFKDKSDADANEFYWDSSDWREGQNSDNEFKLSSFAIIDSLVKQLANKDRFPVLDKIIITGHSSGALFTHVYAGANQTETLYPEIDFEYIVANSQYFHYPNDYRYNEQDHEFYKPTDCFAFNYWPLGYHNLPSYLNGLSMEDFNNQFINRNTIYLLGNGVGSDGALNTANCSATLLGSSRYQRGENMFLFMNEFYPGNHAHSKVIVDGVGHDGKGMYESPEFNTLITQLLNK